MSQSEVPWPINPDHDHRVDENLTDLLRGLVRAFQPKVVMECGSYPGRSTAAFLGALRANGEGVLRIYENSPPWREEIMERFAEGPIEAVDWPDFRDATISLIDSYPEHGQGGRRQLLQQWKHQTAPGSICLVDDVARKKPYAELAGLGLIRVPVSHGVWLIQR